MPIFYRKYSQNFLLPFLFIAALGFIVYANSLKGEFVLDDHFLIENNRYIKTWKGLGKIFTKNIAEGAEENWGFYRPLQMITYALDYFLWGLNPIGYHLTNIILHIIAAMCLYWWINILFGNGFISFLASILFILHPVHTEVVSYISGRADSLAAIFILLCLIFYIKGNCREDVSLSIFAYLFYILALLSRESALITPLLFLLYHYTFKEKINLKKYSAFLTLSFIYILLRFTVLDFGVYYPVSFLRRLPGFFVALTNYLSLILAPFDLHMEYGRRLFSFIHPKAVVGLFILSYLLILAFRKDRRGIAFFSIMWFLLTLLPQANIVYPLNAYMAEHWLYLPSFGVFLLMAKALHFLYNNKTVVRSLGMLLSIGIMSCYAYLTIQYNNKWKDPITIAMATLKYVPDSERMLHYLGTEYNRRGRNEEAIVYYKKAIRINPSNANIYFNLGNAYRQMGNIKEAILSYQRAIEIDPGHSKAYTNLYLLYNRLGIQGGATKVKPPSTLQEGER